MTAKDPPPLRLAAIRLCGYRGFPHPIEIRLDRPGGRGRNLLLYGENGSGKSSIGRALRDLLDFRSTAVPFDNFKYRYTDPPRDDRAVTLIFDDPSQGPLEWNPTDRDKSHPQFADMARSRGWLDYRVVWRASEVQRNRDAVEIFRPLVEEILPGCLRGAGAETFGQAWARITDAAELRPTRSAYRKAEVEELDADIKSFNTSLEGFLTQLQDQANAFLKDFSPWTSIELKWNVGARYDSSKHDDKFAFGSVRMTMKDRNGDPLTNPSEFLNEARLTAIGLCLYLAGMSQSIPPKRADGSSYPRLLVLDDVLLSLDMVHRRPLLNLLSRQFNDWQIVLMTHDRAWYEIARQRLEGWSHHELLAVRVGDYEQPVLREDQDHLYQALEFLQGGYVKAAAVHVRSKFEVLLKWACHELGLAVKYHPDPRKMPASDFWGALKGATVDNIPPVECCRDAKGRFRWWQPPPKGLPVVPQKLRDEIDHAISWILNPLSHSHSVDRYRPEIEEAIYAVDDLETAIRRAICMKRAAPVMLREMLLGLLSHAADETQAGQS